MLHLSSLAPAAIVGASRAGIVETTTADGKGALDAKRAGARRRELDRRVCRATGPLVWELVWAGHRARRGAAHRGPLLERAAAPLRDEVAAQPVIQVAGQQRFLQAEEATAIGSCSGDGVIPEIYVPPRGIISKLGRRALVEAGRRRKVRSIIAQLVPRTCHRRVQRRTFDFHPGFGEAAPLSAVAALPSRSHGG